MADLESKLVKIESALGGDTPAPDVDDKLGWHLDYIESLIEGSSPTPSIKSYIESFDEILDFLNSLLISVSEELPGGFEETYSLEGATVEDICDLWMSIDSEGVRGLMDFMSGQDERGRLECLYDITVNGQYPYEENAFFSGHGDLAVSVETDAETGDARVAAAVYVGTRSVDSDFPVHGTLTIKFVPAN